MIKDRNKVALVTGSEGHIGGEITRKLVSEGYFVYGVDRRDNNETRHQLGTYQFIKPFC